METMHAGERGDPLMRLYAIGFAAGLLAFVVGFFLDQYTSVPALIPGYAASWMMPIQGVVGLFITTGFAVGMRGDLMATWHANLWMLAGLLVGWLAWMGILLAGA